MMSSQDQAISDFNDLGLELLRLSREKQNLEKLVDEGLAKLKERRIELTAVQASVTGRKLNEGLLVQAIQEVQEKSDILNEKNNDLEHLSQHIVRETEELEQRFLKAEATASQKPAPVTNKHFEAHKRSLTDRLMAVHRQNRALKKQEDDAEANLRTIKCQIETLRKNKKLLTKKLAT
eukprot:TRINITY_DN10454_c3_g1_i2.p1 TRINITY_DN10454_c3_g1~~TRINITY_DN10454_c3_g1_i2.p1  ORF type:complete len:193 (+),score=43.29 TRINITY_DN10454_c3_g1_i2:46-579(+)